MATASPPLDPSRLWEIHGRYYDLEPFLDAHPGGRRFLEQLRGLDCTEVFESTHLHDKLPRAMMAKYEVGTNPNYHSAFDWSEGGFYPTVRQRVRDLFEAEARAAGLPRTRWREIHHGSTAFIVRFVGFVLIWAALGVGAFGFGLWWCALPFGLFAFALGGYGHEAMHGGIFRSVWANRLAAWLTLDLQGLSSFVFTAIHVPLHHVHTNVAKIDPDIEVHYPVVRQRPEQPLRWFHRFQPVYAWLLHLVTLPILWANDIVSVTTGVWFGPYGRMRRPSLAEAVPFAFFKVVSFSLFYLLPFLLHPWPLALLVVALAMGGAGLAVQTTFALNHQNAIAMNLDARRSRHPRDWGALQAETTADFHHGHWLPTTFFGGLGYQLEHHLFPTLSYSQLHKVAPIVRATCEEFGIPYFYYPTVFHALWAHAAFLWRMSRPESVPAP